MAEGARLESVFRGNSNVGSNPTLSAIESISFIMCDLNCAKCPHLAGISRFFEHLEKDIRAGKTAVYLDIL